MAAPIRGREGLYRQGLSLAAQFCWPNCPSYAVEGRQRALDEIRAAVAAAISSGPALAYCSLLRRFTAATSLTDDLVGQLAAAQRALPEAILAGPEAGDAAIRLVADLEQRLAAARTTANALRVASADAFQPAARHLDAAVQAARAVIVTRVTATKADANRDLLAAAEAALTAWLTADREYGVVLGPQMAGADLLPPCPARTPPPPAPATPRQAIGEPVPYGTPFPAIR
jgi:hypothetical protein